MTKGNIGAAAILAFAVIVLAPAVGAGADAGEPILTKECNERRDTCENSILGAQRRNKKSEESLLDKVGLGSLEDIPWETFPLALGLSALIGAAGGFVYGGLVQDGRPKRDA